MDVTIAQVIVEIIGILITVLVYIVIYAMTWQKIKDRVSVLEKKTTDVECSIKENQPIWQEIKERLARIETTLEFLKKEKGS